MFNTFTRPIKDKNLKHSQQKAEMRRKMNKEGFNQVLGYLEDSRNYWTKGSKLFPVKKPKGIKGFNIYKLQKVDGCVRKHFKRVKLEAFKKHYYLTKKRNPIIGFTPNYIGFRPGRSVKSYNIVKQYLNFAYNDINEFEVIKRHKYFTTLTEVINKKIEGWTGSPDTNSGHLKQFLLPNSSNIKAEEIIQICSQSNWFNHVTHEFSRPSEMYWCMNYNPKAYNGMYTSKILGHNSKGKTSSASLISAIHLYKTVRTVPMRNFALWEILSREKQVKVEAEELKCSTRVVWTTEEAPTYLLSWMSNFSLKQLCSAKNSNFKAPIQGEFDKDKADKLIDVFSKYDFICDADWSSFDSTIDTEYLIAASTIIFAHVATINDENMRMVFYYIQSLICKFVAIPPGVVIMSDRGNPSGHPGVTLINCIVNMIRWALIGNKIYGPNYAENMDIIVYGDDSFICFKDNHNLQNVDSYINELGYKGDEILPRLFPVKYYWSKIEEKPDFLKRQITCEGIIWTPEKIFTTFIHQTKDRNIVDQCKILENFVITAPNDPAFNEIVIKILKYTYENPVNAKFSKNIKAMLNRVESINEEVTDTNNKNEFNQFNYSNGFLNNWEKSIESTKIDVCEYIPDEVKENKFKLINEGGIGTVKVSIIKALTLLNYCDNKFLEHNQKIIVNNFPFDYSIYYKNLFYSEYSTIEEYMFKNKLPIVDFDKLKILELSQVKEILNSS